MTLQLRQMVLTEAETLISILLKLFVNLAYDVLKFAFFSSDSYCWDIK
jgi:hypothetical protein